MKNNVESVLLVNKEYFPHLGGIETVVKQLAEQWVHKGVKTRILCTGQHFSEEEINGVQVTRTPVNLRIGSARLSFSFLKTFQRLAQDADVLHFHYPNPIGEMALLTSRLPSRQNRRILCSYHSDAVRPAWLVPIYNKMTGAFLGKCDRLFCASPEYCETSPNLARFPEKTQIIPYGVSRQRFQTIGREHLSRAETIASPLPRPLILFTGRLAYYKGLRHLLDALALLPRCGLLIVGEGPEKKALEQHVTDLNLSPRVTILPPLDDALYPAIFQAADVFALPSTHRTEAFGIVGIEAMMAGLPLVTTSLGTGTTYYNLDKITGRIARPAEPQNLAGCIEWILAKENRRTWLAQNARRRAEEHFTEERMIEEYWKEYIR